MPQETDADSLGSSSGYTTADSAWWHFRGRDSGQTEEWHPQDARGNFQHFSTGLPLNLYFVQYLKKSIYAYRICMILCYECLGCCMINQRLTFFFRLKMVKRNLLEMENILSFWEPPVKGTLSQTGFPTWEAQADWGWTCRAAAPYEGLGVKRCAFPHDGFQSTQKKWD